VNKEDLIQIIRDGATLEQTHKIIDYIEQLQNNWNKLKEWLKANDIHYADAIPFRETIKKMQELEKESDVK
jgi:hypothetical protein